eukprot:m.32470 g.32470  ORF g.32470 m.32470 type:complete len:292 (+) comp12153_c0_seq3:68-943(+)
MSLYRAFVSPSRRLLVQLQPSSPTSFLAAVHTRQMSYYSKKKKAMRASMTHVKKSKGQQELMQEESRDIMPSMRQRSLGQIHDFWVPIPSSHTSSLFSSDGFKERWEHIKKRAYSMYSAGMMRFKLETDWNAVDFAAKAQDQYIRMSNILSGKEAGDLRSLATDECAARLKSEFKQKKVQWTYLEDAERPQVVHINLIPVNSKDNLYCQVTVRLFMKVECSNTDQPEEDTGTHLDYVVFEKHLTGKDSQWRIAGNILPLFMLPKAKQEEIRQQRAEYEAKMKQRVKDAAKS